MTSPGSHSIRLREAVRGDAEAILAMEAHFPSDQMSLRRIRAMLESASAKTWIAEREGQVLGNLMLLKPKRHRRARIYSLVVDPEVRGMGIAGRLVKAAEDDARASGRQGLSLEVRCDNHAAQKLYARHGFKLTRKLPAFYEDNSDGVRLTKDFAGLKPSA